MDEQGRPIAGARVVDSTTGLVFLDYVWKAATDAEGRFHIHLPRRKAVRLTVQARGRQPAAREVVPDPDHPEVEFRLPPGKRLRGRFVDPGGHPIAEAWVHIPPFPFCKGISFNARTDAEGRFEWDSATDGGSPIHRRCAGVSAPRACRVRRERPRVRRHAQAGGGFASHRRRRRYRQGPPAVPGPDRHARAWARRFAGGNPLQTAIRGCTVNGSTPRAARITSRSPPMVMCRRGSFHLSIRVSCVTSSPSSGPPRDPRSFGGRAAPSRSRRRRRNEGRVRRFSSIFRRRDE